MIFCYAIRLGKSVELQNLHHDNAYSDNVLNVDTIYVSYNSEYRWALNDNGWGRGWELYLKASQYDEDGREFRYKETFKPEMAWLLLNGIASKIRPFLPMFMWSDFKSNGFPSPWKSLVQRNEPPDDPMTEQIAFEYLYDLMETDPCNARKSKELDAPNLPYDEDFF